MNVADDLPVNVCGGSLKITLTDSGSYVLHRVSTLTTNLNLNVLERDVADDLQMSEEVILEEPFEEGEYASNVVQETRHPTLTKKRCYVENCNGNDSNSSMFRFPNVVSTVKGVKVINEEQIVRCKTWVQNLGDTNLLSVDVSKLYQRFYLCGKHFTSDQFINKKKRVLKTTAVPTIFENRRTPESSNFAFHVTYGDQLIPVYVLSKSPENEDPILNAVRKNIAVGGSFGNHHTTETSNDACVVADAPQLSEELVLNEEEEYVSNVAQEAQHLTRCNRKCWIAKCDSNSFNSSLFSFPNTVSTVKGVKTVNHAQIERCKIWLQNAGKDNLPSVDIEKLNQRVYLCEKHFTCDQFTDEKRVLLKRNAVPTIFEIQNFQKGTNIDQACGGSVSNTSSQETFKRRECCAPGCGNTNLTSKVFSFPSIHDDSDTLLTKESIRRFKQWVRNCGNAKLLLFRPEWIVDKYFLCSSHFETSMFTTFKNLREDAVPTLFSTSPVSSEEFSRYEEKLDKAFVPSTSLTFDMGNCAEMAVKQIKEEACFDNDFEEDLEEGEPVYEINTFLNAPLKVEYSDQLCQSAKNMSEDDALMNASVKVENSIEFNQPEDNALMNVSVGVENSVEYNASMNTSVKEENSVEYNQPEINTNLEEYILPDDISNWDNECEMKQDKVGDQVQVCDLQYRDYNTQQKDAESSDDSNLVQDIELYPSTEAHESGGEKSPEIIRNRQLRWEKELGRERIDGDEDQPKVKKKRKRRLLKNERTYRRRQREKRRERRRDPEVRLKERVSARIRETNRSEKKPKRKYVKKRNLEYRREERQPVEGPERGIKDVAAALSKSKTQSQYRKRRSEDPEYRRKENERNAERLRIKRANDPVFREKERARDLLYKRIKRASDPVFRQKERAQDLLYKWKRRGIEAASRKPYVTRQSRKLENVEEDIPRARVAVQEDEGGVEAPVPPVFDSVAQSDQ